MSELGKYIGKIDQDFATTRASVKVLVETYRKSVGLGDSREMTFAHLARWLINNRPHAEVVVLLAGAIDLLAQVPGEVACTCPAIQGTDGKHRAYCAKVLAVRGMAVADRVQMGPEAFDHLPADHPAPVTMQCRCPDPNHHGPTAVDGETGAELPLPRMLDEVRAQVVDALADLPAARDERRCVAPPMGCGKPLVDLGHVGFTPLVSFFRDLDGAREYSISGWCQACQDRMFADPDEVDGE